MPKTKEAAFLGLALTALFLSGCATVSYRPPLMRQAGVYHIVGSGQTLYGISKAYSVDIKEIMRLNNIANPNLIGVGERLFIPRAGTLARKVPYVPVKAGSVEELVGPRQHKVRWRTITLHHSATLEGNAEAFDRNHRQRGMGGLAYHFVIGNGHGSGDGEIEVGWRWRRQRETNRKEDIQICVIGDFTWQEMDAAQFNSLVKLLQVLTRQYSIPVSHIRKHQDAPARATACPGNNFPLGRILAELRRG